LKAINYHDIGPHLNPGVKEVYFREMQSSALDEQVRQFIAHMDVLADRLAPSRRLQDRDKAECSIQELRVLSALGQRDALNMSDLAAVLKVQLSSATHTVDKLVSKGLVQRKRVNEDRRVVQVAFSRKGKKINQFVVQSRLAVGRGILEALAPKEREKFLKRMGTIATASAEV